MVRHRDRHTHHNTLQQLPRAKRQKLTSCWDRRPFGHNRHGPKSGGLLYPFFWGELGPHLTQCGLRWGLPLYQVSSWSIQPFGHNRHGPKSGASVPLSGGRGYICPHVTQCSLGWGLLPYQLASCDPCSRLATTYMSQKFRGEGGTVPLFEGNLELGPHLTQCGWGWGLPASHVVSWILDSSNRLATIQQLHKEDRIDKGPMDRAYHLTNGRQISETGQNSHHYISKPLNQFEYCFNYIVYPASTCAKFGLNRFSQYGSTHA